MKNLSTTVNCLAATACAAMIASMAACGERTLSSPSSPTRISALDHANDAADEATVDLNVLAISPDSGPITGGTPITISGTDFVQGATVAFGTARATDVLVIDTMSITANTPPGVAGTVDVIVANPDGRSATLPGGFTYTAEPSTRAACQVDLARNLATWSSSGTSVSGFITKPLGDGPFSAALVLHTRGGLGTHEHLQASLFADRGYVALAPDFFTPEGITPQSFDLSTTLTVHVDRIREHVSGGIECLKSLAYVDSGRIGTVGFSLGGYFGLIVGARDDVKAVVSYYGAYHGEGASRISTRYAFTDVAAQVRARVLMFHGDADGEVGINLAQNANRRLREAGKQAELVVYPGVGHRFDRIGTPTYDAQATADAGARTLAFLP